MMPATDIRHYHADHLGSTNVVTDADAALVSETVYYPFGMPRHEHYPGEPPAAPEYLFGGKELDRESGLQYFEKRYLANAVGRFSRVDPLWRDMPAEWLVLPQKLNLYSYARNNPLKFIDPTGEKEVVFVTEKELAHIKAVSRGTWLAGKVPYVGNAIASARKEQLLYEAFDHGVISAEQLENARRELVKEAIKGEVTGAIKGMHTALKWGDRARAGIKWIGTQVHEKTTKVRPHEQIGGIDFVLGPVDWDERIDNQLAITEREREYMKSAGEPIWGTEAVQYEIRKGLREREGETLQQAYCREHGCN
jgi:RHS repeat-associated protein